MDPITAAAAMGSSVVGNLLGSVFGAGARRREREMQDKAVSVIEALKLPTVEEQQLALEKLVQQGEITPEEIQTIALGQTEMADISTDPRLRNAQMDALEKLSRQGEEGLTAVDRAALNQVRSSVAQDARARNEAVLQNMAQRGMGGSGAELAAQLSNSQAAALRASEESDRLAAMAQQRALEATMSGANLAGQVQGRDFEQQAAIARAKDEIARYNAMNAQRVGESNVGARNRAQEMNLGERQRIADANVGLGNQQQQYNKQLLAQQADRERELARLKAGAYAGRATGHQADAQRTQDMFSGIGQAGSRAIAGFAGGAGSATPSAAQINNAVASGTRMSDLGQRIQVDNSMANDPIGNFMNKLNNRGRNPTSVA